MTEAGGAFPSTPQPHVPPRELPDAARLTYVLRQRFSYTYDTPVRDLDHQLIVIPPRRHGNQQRRRHSITVSAADARTTHRRDAAGNIVTRSHVPLVPDKIEFAVDAVVERTGPGTGMLVPAAALTGTRLLRPTRLTAADAASGTSPGYLG
jgi:Bacterial transglutaminase-like N-terminal region